MKNEVAKIKRVYGGVNMHVDPAGAVVHALGPLDTIVLDGMEEKRPKANWIHGRDIKTGIEGWVAEHLMDIREVPSVPSPVEEPPPVEHAPPRPFFRNWAEFWGTFVVVAVAVFFLVRGCTPF